MIKVQGDGRGGGGGIAHNHAGPFQVKQVDTEIVLGKRRIKLRQFSG